MESKMLTRSDGFYIQNLSENSYHIWKQNIERVLVYREVDAASIGGNQH